MVYKMWDNYTGQIFGMLFSHTSPESKDRTSKVDTLYMKSGTDHNGNEKWLAHVSLPS